MMRLFVLNAVVGRIVNFPIRGVVGHGRVGLRKRFLAAKNLCNITWGYVAWIGGGRGPGAKFQGGGGPRRVGLRVQRIPREMGETLCKVCRLIGYQR